MMADSQPETKTGALAAKSASAPVPLAQGTWLRDGGSALADLEFADALDRVAARAAGPLAARRIRDRAPSNELRWIRTELARVAEAAAFIRRGEPLEIAAVADVAPGLARLRLEGSVLSLEELVPLRLLILSASTVAASLARVSTEAPLLAELHRDPPDGKLGKLMDRAVGDDGRLLDGATQELAAARKAVLVARDRLIRKLEALLQRSGSDGQVTLREGRYVIPVRRDQRDGPRGIVHDESASAETLYVEPTEAIELGNALREAEGREQRETVKALRFLTESLRPHRAELADVFEMCLAVDEVQARARYAVEIDGHVPEIDEPPVPLVLKKARHPLLLGTELEVVPFSLELDSNEHTVVVSGPNTGGKTVLLKTVGLICAMAQSGIVPPIGPGSRLPLFSSCFADIGDHQSIAASLSTFSGHLQALRGILADAGHDSLVLIDEMGSGTDPAEGAALAAAVLQTLTRRGCTTIATTHLGALKQLADRVPQIVNASLQFDPDTLRPTYLFQKGIPGRSYGLAIGRRLGLDPEVLAEAERGVPEAERHMEALLEKIERQTAALAAREAELSRQEAESDRARARLVRDRADLTEREERLRSQEKTAERRAREQAKSYLLEARRRVEQALGLARAAVDEATAREARRLVEEGVKAESEALRQSVPEDQSRGQTDIALAPGVEVTTAAGVSGSVEELRGDGKVVVIAGGMRLVVAADDIVATRQAGERQRESSRNTMVHDESGVSLEIDLRGMTGDEAQAATVAALDAAVLADQPYLRIIHGKGTGVVRQRVREVLQHDGRVRAFQFAGQSQGGTGVTVAEF